MNIYPANPTHYDELVLVWLASVKATHDFLSDDDIAFFHQHIAADYFPAVALYYTVDEAQNITGFIGVADKQVEMLFIHPSSRGHGIGKALLKYALTELGVQTVDVNEQNQQAVDFYLHMGAKVMGRSERDGMGKPFPLLHLAFNKS